MKIIGISDAPIPRPLALNWRVRSVVVHRDLVRAIQRESVKAVAHWWRISVEKVRLIRRALDVPDFNEATIRLHRRNGQTPAFIRKVLRKAWANAGSPERRETNRRSHLGRFHTKASKQKIAVAHRGRSNSLAARRKVSEALKRNGTWRRWTQREGDVVLRYSTPEAAELTGRTIKAVFWRRNLLRSRLMRRDQVSAPSPCMMSNDCFCTATAARCGSTAMRLSKTFCAAKMITSYESASRGLVISDLILSPAFVGLSSSGLAP